MGQVINTNILSLTAQRNLQSSQSDLATSLQRLSSGLRINSAKDDAAGLAISERFTTQIRGLNQAIRNSNDGISLAQTGEAALATVTDNLQRIRELAVQSVNATNSDTDRATLQQEVEQRLNEIDRIAGQTSFNGRNVLDGSFGSALFQVGANVGETIGLDLQSSVRSADIGQVATATSVDLSTVISSGEVTLGAGDLTIGGTDITGSFTDAAGLAAAINSAGVTGLSAAVSGAEVELSNSTLSSISVSADMQNLITAASVPAAAGVDGTANIAAAEFDQVRVGTAITVSGTGVTDGTVVAAGNYTLTELNALFNTYEDGTDGAGAITAAVVSGQVEVTNGSGNDITFAGGIGDISLSGSAISTGNSTSTSATFDQFLVTDLTVDLGDGGGADTITGASYDAAGLLAQINTDTGATIAATDGSGGIDITNATANDFTFAGTDATTLGVGTVSAQSAGAAGTASTDGVATALSNAGAASLTITDLTIQFGDNAALAVGNTTYTTQQDLVDAINTALGSNGTASLNSTTNVVSITSGEDITIGGTDATTVFTSATNTVGGDLGDTSVATVADSNTAIQRVDAALTSVSDLRSTFGAIQNRFESTIENLTTTAENLQASRSRILDADFAQETANLTRAQILQQAGISVLAQANVQPQSVLALLN